MRQVSALAVVAEGDWWLFDCGEGTQMRIVRAGLSFHRLAGIFITHLHGDHFNGLSGLLSTMALERRERPLVLVSPPGTGEYLETLARLRVLFYNYPLTLIEVGSTDFVGENAMTVYQSNHYLIGARALDHRIFALGYRIEEKPKPGRFNLERARELGIPEGPLFGRLQSGLPVELEDGRIIQPSEVLGPPRAGKSIAYCLDTRPCVQSVELGRDADWLIHEATYTDVLTEEAHAYGHSTASDAARTAREAGAQNLLITHFSSRYPDARPLLEEAQMIFPNTTMAEDLMEIDV